MEDKILDNIYSKDIKLINEALFKGRPNLISQEKEIEKVTLLTKEGDAVNVLKNIYY